MNDATEPASPSRAFSRRAWLGLALTTTAALGLAACGKSSDDGGTAPSDDPKAIAADAYTFGYPLVLMDATRAQAEALTPVNQFQHASTLPTPERRDVVRLNLDTLYSIAWLDLTAEPIVLQVPGMESDRYWLMQIMDAWTNTAHNPGSAHPQPNSGAASPPFTYALTGPGWSGRLPEGVTPLPMPTPTVWVLGRVQVNGDADIPNVRAIQQRMKLVPLSAWNAGQPAPVAPVVPVDLSVPSAKQVDAMDPRSFFAKLCALLAIDPPAAADAPAMERFAKLGIKPGGSVTGISDDDLAAAVQTSKKQFADYQDPAQKNENGWQFATDLGAYGTDYQLRAMVALKGLGANLAEDAVYPSLFGTADTDGTPNRYRLHFPAGQLPPVAAFWSLTAYDAESYLIPNPANVYAIGHQIPVTPNPDGSLDLAVQSADPGASVPVGNWLPIPASGPFSLTMRLYAPKDSVLKGDWQVPALTKL
ncbi:DUF1254 domain-containing protein [Nocardia sp. 2]|uniref:DUF1254 domain-containing protein n=1 Tax=Nocardia acididurans TaxID=2802282 RepID=A0ABS1MDI5_9NOCA|nr:DUF1254 domain-containing protein [Nocardia acididurans]MBL1078693.1 DUF1254 domain-containing protein [Nocardia acididurans]